VIPNLLLGRYVVLFEKFTVDHWIEAVVRLKPKSFVVPPTVLRMIIDAKVPAEALASVDYVYGGGARLAPELQAEFEAIYSVKVLWGFGATEFCGTIAGWSPELYERFDKTKRGSVGRILPGIQVRTVDVDTGDVQATNEQGYLEALIPEISDDWVHTTDIVRIDEDGFIFHLGRGDGAIVRGGFKILPESIVAALKQHPQVGDVGVVGLPDQRLGHVPVAVVEASPGAEPQAADLAAFARRHLLAQQVPAHFLVVSCLPRNGTLKVDQRALFDLVEQRLGKPGMTQAAAAVGDGIEHAP
jgi:acyl-coenzyme A synthetase/AMP-(fatty) acid ligase